MSYWTKAGVDRVIFGGIFTSLSASALIFVASRFLCHPLDYVFLVLIFIVSLIIYLFDYLYELFEKKKCSLTTLILFCCFSLLVILSLYKGYLRNISMQFMASMLIFLILGISYPAYFKIMTKKITGFKNYFVAITWNMAVWLYLIYAHVPLNISVVLFLLIIFLRDFMNSIFCDLKDKNEDHKKGLRTFVVLLGEGKAIIMIGIINAISMMLIILGFILGISRKENIIYLIPVILISVFIYFSQKSRKWNSYIVDVEYFCWAIISLIF